MNDLCQSFDVLYWMLCCPREPVLSDGSGPVSQSADDGSLLPLLWSVNTILTTVERAGGGISPSSLISTMKNGAQ